MEGKARSNKLTDGSVVLVELKPDVAEFILTNDREMANADRKERYHTPYHIDALEYEGEDYADHEPRKESITGISGEHRCPGDEMKYVLFCPIRRWCDKAGIYGKKRNYVLFVLSETNMYCKCTESFSASYQFDGECYIVYTKESGDTTALTDIPYTVSAGDYSYLDKMST